MKFKDDDFKAYFGGEVISPVNRYILFCKDSEVIDTIPLQADNTFFKTFDSLAPGLYSFKHEPEYQYVYFDKNDSLMVRINAKDFDESIVFCGRGDQKNNFLMELYLKNEADKSKIYPVFDLPVAQFNQNIDSSYKSIQKFYASKKKEIQWSDSFDSYARAAMNFHYYSKKEVYPTAHRLRTGTDVTHQLPKDFYAFRKEIDFNNSEFSNFVPYVSYLSFMLNNMAAINYHNHFSDADLALKTNINKLKIADSLLENKEIKNTILNNIAFTYLLEDQNMVNNQQFLKTFHQYSVDKSNKNEINKISQAIDLLKPGNPLPEVKLVDLNGMIISSNSLLNKKTVLFCWTEKLNSHFIASHKKILAFKEKHPDYQFVAINFDNNQQKWVEKLSNYKLDGIIELRCNNFEDLKYKWAITKIHRTIILHEDGTIKDAFTNLFDVKFEDHLE